MSNCDFVAGRSLIDLGASRLALHAPALGAASRRFCSGPADYAAVLASTLNVQ
jgi:hypothetical protein